MLTEDVLSFLRSRPIAMVGSRDRELRPTLCEAMLAEITETHVVAAVPEHLASNLAENVADNGRGSVLVARAPGDHRSVQLKGKLSQFEPARRRPDLAERIADALEEAFALFMPREQVRPYLLAFAGQPTVAVRLDVEEVFDQTPGPGAGQRVLGATP
jgi:hypothetical protein